MSRRPLELTKYLLGSALVLIIFGCGAQGTSAGSGGPSETPASTVSLAPAGPPSGGAVEETDSRAEQGPAAQLVESIGCVEEQGQEPLPRVTLQLSCRIGAERVYVLTFDTAADRDSYLGQVEGPQVVTGGWNVVGPTWVVHVDSQSTADRLARQLNAGATQGPS